MSPAKRTDREASFSPQPDAKRLQMLIAGDYHDAQVENQPSDFVDSVTSAVQQESGTGDRDDESTSSASTTVADVFYDVSGCVPFAFTCTCAFMMSLTPPLKAKPILVWIHAPTLIVTDQTLSVRDD